MAYFLVFVIGSSLGFALGALWRGIFQRVGALDAAEGPLTIQRHDDRAAQGGAHRDVEREPHPGRAPAPDYDRVD